MLQKIKNKKLVIALCVCLVLMAFAVPAFAQTDTLNIDDGLITENLFKGANIVINAIGAIVFLIVGIAFGAIILRAIANMITSMRFF